MVNNKKIYFILTFFLLNIVALNLSKCAEVAVDKYRISDLERRVLCETQQRIKNWRDFGDSDKQGYLNLRGIATERAQKLLEWEYELGGLDELLERSERREWCEKKGTKGTKGKDPRDTAPLKKIDDCIATAAREAIESCESRLKSQKVDDETLVELKKGLVLDSECACISRDKRKAVEDLFIENLKKTYTPPEDKRLNLIFFGSGGLYQEFIFICRLIKEGYRFRSLFFVDITYNESYSGERDSGGLMDCTAMKRFKDWLSIVEPSVIVKFKESIKVLFSSLWKEGRLNRIHACFSFDTDSKIFYESCICAFKSIEASWAPGLEASWLDEKFQFYYLPSKGDGSVQIRSLK
jgi:hypothetical protein